MKHSPSHSSHCSDCAGAVQRLPRNAGRAMIWIYRHTLSPLVGYNCRHLPTCSVYGDEAIERFGLWGGITEGERRAIFRRRGIRLPYENHEDEDGDGGAPDTLRDLWDQRTQLVDGHMKWTSSTPVSFRGHTTTPQRIGFQLDRGRQPVGIVRRTCLVKGCVLPAHLADQAERNALRKVAA